MNRTPPDEDEKARGGNTARDLAQLASIGIMFPVSIGTGFVIGWWLDGLFGTWPWLAGFFTACGIAAAFVNLFRASAGSGRDDG